MPTSFSQVHLPPHTIDSVRTVVSLPLLHPAAFQKGILKSHGINGVLLFGPPGTGKTLVARALAKEAGCRMLAINPSDVMDMVIFFYSSTLPLKGVLICNKMAVRWRRREACQVHLQTRTPVVAMCCVSRRDRCPVQCPPFCT